MAHHGYIPVAIEFMRRIDSPRILEIGVDRGQTTIPLAFWLTHSKKQFKIDCVDIQLDPSLEVILRYTGLLCSPFLTFHVQNSLSFLESLDSDVFYDIVFLDGDHNYFTVSRELELLKGHIHTGTLVIIDDYLGRWSEKDLFYAERASHAGNTLATPHTDTEKHGVKAAVDDFLNKNADYAITAPIQGEPVILYLNKKAEENAE